MLDIHIQPYFILQTLMRETCRHESQNQADATDRGRNFLGSYILDYS